MFKDFRKFILRGNTADLVIGFTVGAAFSSVAKSFVEDILMPPIGLVLGQADFSNMFIIIKKGTVPPPYHTAAAARAVGAITINYGVFLNNVISLFIVGLAVYVLIKFINSVNDQLEELPLVGKKKKVEQEEPTVKKCPYCLTTIPYKATKCGACTSDLLKPQEKK